MSPIEKERIPIGWVFTLLSTSGTGLIVAISCVIYISNIKATADVAASTAVEAKKSSEVFMDGMSAKIDRIDERTRVMDSRLSRIEGSISK